MAEFFGAKVKGFTALERMIKELPATSQRKVVVTASKKSAQYLQKEIKIAARLIKNTGKTKYVRSPASRRYGHLSQNIRVSPVSRAKHSVVFDVHTNNAFWAQWIEYGSPKGKIKATPFIRPVVDTKYRKAIQTFSDEVGPALEKEAARLARKYGAKA